MKEKKLNIREWNLKKLCSIKIELTSFVREHFEKLFHVDEHEPCHLNLPIYFYL